MTGGGGGSDGGGGGTTPVGVGVPIVFVSRQIHPDGSFYWDSAKDMAGVGAHSRTRPSAPGKLLLLSATGELRTLIDGAAPTAATLNLVDVNSPTVSYDGTRIAFAGLPARSGGQQWPLTGVGSSNGGQYANPGAWRLYVMNADGTNLRAIGIPDEVRDMEYQRRLGPAAASLSGYDDFDPCWLPDDEHLVFSSTRYPSYGHYSGARASQLFTVKSDGTELKRITSERNGADRPLVDPVTGAIVYARWWRNFHFPTDDLTDAPPSGNDETGVPNVGWRNDVLGIDYQATEQLWKRHNGLTADRYARQQNDTMFRNAWQVSSINPDGTNLHMWTGLYRSELENHYYGGGFADDGTLFGNFFPMLNMTEAAGFGGIRELQRGPHDWRGVVGAYRVQTDPSAFVEPNAKNGAPSYGIYKELYAGEPEVLPVTGGMERNGRVLFSRTAMISDIGQDYGLYVMERDGSSQSLIYDAPGTAELRPRVVAPRTKPPQLPLLTTAVSQTPPRPTTLTTSDVNAMPTATQLSGAPGSINQDGTFTFTVLNVYANAGVDVPIVSAIPIGTAAELIGFTNYQRHSQGSFPVVDWPIELERAAITPQGFSELTPPAHVSLFEQIRSADGGIAQTDGVAQPLTDALAHVAGLNYGVRGTQQVCVGCHAGHSMIPVPPPSAMQREIASWSNLAPGAVVTASASDPNGSRLSALVDRQVERIDNLFYAYKSPQNVRQGVTLTLTFPVPIEVREVVLWNQVQRSNSTIRVTQSTTRLFSDVGKTQQVGQSVQSGALNVTGDTVVAISGTGVRVVEVTLDTVTGQYQGYDIATLGEIEVIARGQ